MKTEILEHKGYYYMAIVINGVVFFVFSRIMNFDFGSINIYSSIGYSVDTAYKQFRVDCEMRKEYYSNKDNHKPL
jgi:hypothetical protein